MTLSKPAYYDTFRCIAGSCPDSCCKEWSVTVDEFSAQIYRTLPGELGDKLRAVLADEDGQTVMSIENGRCPMWRTDGLCRIQAELGEEALCDVCQEFPRLSHDFGDFVELQLELSCPEAARLILTSPPMPRVTWEEPGGDDPEYDPADMASMLRLREELLAILESDALTTEQALLKLYQRGGGEVAEFGKGDLASVIRVFQSLEMLTDRWPQLLNGAKHRPLDEKCRNLARYLLERYWLRGESDTLTDTLGKITFIVLSCLVVNSLEGDFIANAQLFSKEIENSDCNPDDLMDAAYISPAFSGENITGLLRS